MAMTYLTADREVFLSRQGEGEVLADWDAWHDQVDDRDGLDGARGYRDGLGRK